MNHYRKTTLLLLTIATLMVAGCASSVETRISSQGKGVTGTPALMWQAEPESDRPAAQAGQAKALVARHLEQQGFRFADAAPVTLSVGVAQRAARLGLLVKDSESLSPAEQKNRGLGCKGRLMRVSISMTDSATGQMLYTGRAQEAHCRASLDEALPHLVSSALADMAAPAGDRLLISPVRN